MKKKIILNLIVCFSFFKLCVGQAYEFKEISSFKGFALSCLFKNSESLKFKSNKNLNPHQNIFSNNVGYDFYSKIGNSLSIPMDAYKDANDNTYVVGKSGNSTNNSGDITILKINAQGELLWSTSIPSPEFTVNSANFISSDPNGFIYVVGNLWVQSSTNIVCIKLDAQGQIVWQSNIGLPNHFHLPTAFNVMPNGSVLIAGITHVQNKVTYHVSKLNASGNVEWVYTDLEFPEDTWNEPKAIKVDTNNNIIVTGYGYNQSDKSNVVTIKLSQTGSVIWRVLKEAEIFVENQLTETDIWPEDLIIDNANNIYIVSNFLNDFWIHSLTHKYNSNGWEDWEYVHQIQNESIQLKKIAFVNNNVIVGGYHNGTGEDGFNLYSLNLNGSVNWSQSTNESWIYQTGFSMNVLNNQINLDATFLNLDTSGNMLKTKKFLASEGTLSQSLQYNFNNDLLGSSINFFVKPLITNNNKTIVFSTTYPDKGSIIEVTKLDSIQENIIWNFKYEPNNTRRANIYESVSDSNSNVFSIISKFYVLPNDVNTIFQKSYLVKYNQLGSITNSIEIDDSEGIASLSLKVDQGNNLIVFKRPSTSENVSLVKYANDLSEIWNFTFPLPSNSIDKILTDQLNNIYIINSEPTDPDTNLSKVFVRKYNTNGVLIYHNLFQPEDSTIIASYAINANFSNNDLVITGVSTDGLNNGFNLTFKPFLLKILPNGDMSFFKHYNLSGYNAQFVELISYNNNFYLFVNTEDLNSGINEIKTIKIDTFGQLINSYTYSLNNTNIYLQNVLFSVDTASIFIVSSNLSDIGSNIQVSSWDLNGNMLNTFNLGVNQYYQDAYLNNENIFILTQSQNNLNFPYRLLNWVGPFIASSVVKLNHSLQSIQNYEFIGPNYSLYEPKQIIPLNNENLLIAGRLFHEELFFEGLKFYNISLQPELNTPELPIAIENLFYCYPVPTKNTLKAVIKTLKGTNRNLIIYDLNGKILKEVNLNNGNLNSNHLELDVSYLKTGIYLLKLIDDEDIHTVKFIIE